MSSPAGQKSLVSELTAGLIAGALVLSFTISIAALIFSGDAARYLGPGVGIMLVSSAVLGAIIASGTTFRPITAAAQDNTGVLLALVAADIQAAAPGKDVLPTIVAALAVTSLAVGGAFYALGKLRLGKVVRFIPFPVVGGFLAGTGWLLVQGSLGVMSGAQIDLQHLGALADVDPVRWAPGAAFGLVLTFALRRIKHHLALPILLAAAFAICFGAIAASGIGMSGAGARGLLLGPLPSGGLWPPISAGDVSSIDWSFLGRNVGNILACVLLAVIGMLLNASGYELATEQDVDQDRELRVHGVANVVTGALGGAPGWMMLGGSMLSFRAGARGKIAGIVVAATCLIALFAGTGVVGYLPKPVLGGLLFMLGASFLVENVYDAWFKLPRGEYALVLAILGVVVAVGFLQGVAFGIVVSAVLFALNYARVGVVRHEASGAAVRSKASRTVADEDVLRRDGAQVHVFQLQGYIFFGTAHGLLQQVSARVAAGAKRVILDFKHVTGLDASAVVSFVRMKKLVEAQAQALVLAELPPQVYEQLQRGAAVGGKVQIVDDIDRGLEVCERAVLAAAPPPAEASQARGAIDRVLHDPDLVRRLLERFETIEVASGADVFRAGDPSDAVFVIESGEVEAWLDLGNGKTRRLRAMGPGTVLGESGLYLGAGRSAGVRATAPTVLRRLSVAALDQMTREAPELAAAFHRFVAATLADRLVTTTSASALLLQ